MRAVLLILSLTLAGCEANASDDAALKAAEAAIAKHDAIADDSAFAAMGVQKAELCVHATVVAENLARASDPRAADWDRKRRYDCAAVVG